MCDNNINNILNLDFNQVNDEVNWSSNSINPIQTIDDKLLLLSDSGSTYFTRNIGNIDSSNNRIKVKCNFEVKKTDSSAPSNMEVLFRLVSGSTVLHESCVDFSGLSEGVNVSYFLERDFIYNTPINSPISLMVLIPTGWENKLFLSDLSVSDFNFCQDNIRTYFIIEQLFEDSIMAKAGGIQLLEWKVDGIETLTTEFFNDTNIIGGVPVNEWLFAKADLDGDNRVSEIVSPNTFNPFSNEFKLKFNTVNSFHGGKPIGTNNGGDYGDGILEIGVDKPIILNGDLDEKKGGFFIDINYNISLKVVFNVIINKKDINLFTRPTYIRKYIIEWDTKNCEKRFYYIEDGIEVDQSVNGFLSGLTGQISNETIVGCDQLFSPAGNVGDFSYSLDFGTGIGQAGINYEAFDFPDRFIIEWNGSVVADSGFVGSSAYDSQLIAAGVSSTDINTSSPSNGNGSLVFNKTSAYPSQATITVLAPLSGTGWNVSGICPDGNTGGPGVMLQVTKGKCNATLSGTTIWTDVYIDNILNVGVGAILYTDAALTIPFDGGGFIGNFWRIQTTDGLIYNSVYSILNDGVISNATSCGNVGNLTINSSVPNSNGGGFGGTLDFANGQANEVLNLSFGVLFDVDGEFTAANFGSPVSLGVLDNTHLSRNGTVTLDSNGNGNGSSSYQISDHDADGVSIVVNITGRSSSEPMPSSNSTNINL